MTSLAKQLQRLAVPHTQALLGRDTSRHSLLFDPKEAAQLDKETFYALGLNGLEELENIDPKFQTFEETLFSESSLTFERSVQSKEINQTLDEDIAELLTHLSPYFMLKPAHKVVEWLIYRYHVQFYNVDELMRCVLPYHETKIFTRVIQLLKLDGAGSKWEWLLPLQKSGMHLPHSVLINHCKTNPGFLGFLCETVKKYSKILALDGLDGGKLRVLFSFYTSTIVGMLEADGGTEGTISTLIPHLSRGLKTRLPDHKASSYMILCQLVSKVKLKVSVLETLLNVLAKHMIPELLKEALSCIVLIFQTQKIDELPKKYVCRVPHLDVTLGKISNMYQTDKLTQAFLTRLIPVAIKKGGTEGGASSDSEGEQDWLSTSPDYCPLLEAVLREAVLEKNTANFVTRKIIECYIDRCAQTSFKLAENERLNASLKGTIRVLETRYSDALDFSLERLLQEANTDDRRSDIQQFIDLTLTSIQHHVIADDCSNLTLALHHRLGDVRAQAMQHLINHVDKLQEDDFKFVEETILNGLRDDYQLVVKTTLQMGPRMWKHVSDKQTLITLLRTVLQKQDETPNSLLSCPCLTVLCSSDGKMMSEIFTSIYPYLLVRNADGADVAMVTTILQSDFTKENPILAKSRKAWLSTAQKQKGEESVDALNLILVKSIIKELMAMTTSNRQNVVEKIISGTKLCCNRESSCIALTGLVLNGLLEQEKDGLLKLSVFAMAQTALLRNIVCNQELSGETKDVTGDLNTEKGVQCVGLCLRNGKALSLHLCTGWMYNLISQISVHPTLSIDWFWHQRNNEPGNNASLKVLISVFHLLLELSGTEDGSLGPYRSLLVYFIKTHLSNPSLQMKFLGVLWSSHANDQANALGLNLRIQLRALHIGLVQLKHLPKKSLTALLQSAWPVLVPLLMGVTSRVTIVRNMSVRCFKVIQDRSDKYSTPYLSIIKKIVRCGEEITTDQKFIAQALNIALDNLTSEATPEEGKKKSGSKKAAVKSALNDLIGIIVRENTPVYIVKSLLTSLRLHNNEDMFIGFLPLLKRLLEMNPKEMNFDHLTVFHLLLERFSPQTARLLTEKSLTAFLMALKCTFRTGSFSSVQESALLQITKKFYGCVVYVDSRQKILSTLLDILMAPESVAVSNLVRKTLKHIILDAGHISCELNSVFNSVDAATFKEVKKLKSKKPSESDEGISCRLKLESPQWERVSHILEVIQSKKKVRNSLILVAVLFKLIARILEVEEDGSGEYLKQLSLGCIYNITTRHLLVPDGEQDNKVAAELNVELIVQCIRSSENPQTHHHALLLLTVAAKVQPVQLLHNVMSIFTFMGTNILRQDDSYSFHVISSILETVIPSLVTTAKSNKSVAIEEVITMVIRVFVDSYPYIPSHRRLMLFKKLATVVGEGKYLWRLLLMLTDLIISSNAKTQEDEDTAESKPSSVVGGSDMEFYLQFCTSFAPVQQLCAAKDVLVYLSSLPETKEDTASPLKGAHRGAKAGKSGKMQDTEIFNINSHSAKQLRHFKYAAVSQLVNLFESDTFLGQVAACDEAKMLTHYQDLMKTIMEYVTQLSKTAEANQANPSSMFWRALQHKVYDLLEKVVALLPDQTFFEVSAGLMKHDLPNVQRRAMELLNNKLQAQKEITSETEVEVLLSIVVDLSKIIKKTVLRSNTGEEKAVIGQTALFGLKVLCRHLANKHPKPFIQVLKLATKVLESRGDNPPVAACALLCVAEICNCLKVHVIEHLSAFVPKLLHVFEEGETLASNELLLLSAVTALHKLVENVTHFLSQYLLDILQQVCSLSSIIENSSRVQKLTLLSRLKAIRYILAANVPVRVLLPSLVSCYDRISSQNWENVISLMSLLAEHLQEIDKEQISSHHNQIVQFFYTCLDFRASHKEVPEEILSQIEASVIDAIITMVMKLSEATFRPMIFKLYDWATRHDEDKDRVLVFYRLADNLAEKLRSLFTLFAGHMIKHTARMLDKNNKAKEGPLFFGKKKSGARKSDRLLQYLFSYLYRCFLYDNVGFLNKERFQALMQPLCDQIENTIGGDELFEMRIVNHLVPCLAQFAVAAQDDASWRALNYQILLKTRSSSVKVRYAALLVLDQLHKKLGEDYMSLLPETIPFLAELMEDDSEIEKKCQTVIAEMEKTLGEPLQKFF